MEKKFNNKKLIAGAIAISSLALLSGCGSSSGGGTPVPATAGVAGIGGGCVPIATTTMIGFNATNMYLGNPQLNGDTRVLAGIIPGGDQLATGNYGTMVVIPGNVAPPVATGYTAPITFQGQRVDGTSLSLTVTGTTTPQTAQTWPYSNGMSNYNTGLSGAVNANGYIQISSFVQQALIQVAQGTYNSGYGNIVSPMGGYPTGYYPTGVAAPQICVSNLAFSLQRTNASFANWLYMGTVYFYLTGGVSNGQHGLALNF